MPGIVWMYCSLPCPAPASQPNVQHSRAGLGQAHMRSRTSAPPPPTHTSQCALALGLPLLLLCRRQAFRPAPLRLPLGRGWLPGPGPGHRPAQLRHAGPAAPVRPVRHAPRQRAAHLPPVPQRGAGVPAVHCVAQRHQVGDAGAERCGGEGRVWRRVWRRQADGAHGRGLGQECATSMEGQRPSPDVHAQARPTSAGAPLQRAQPSLPWCCLR